MDNYGQSIRLLSQCRFLPEYLGYLSKYGNTMDVTHLAQTSLIHFEPYATIY